MYEKNIFLKKNFDSRKITENNAHLNGIYFKIFLIHNNKCLLRKLNSV